MVCAVFGLSGKGTSDPKPNATNKTMWYLAKQRWNPKTEMGYPKNEGPPHHQKLVFQ